MHGARDHRAYERDADEEAAQDRSSYKEIDGSHDALRPMTHSHACKTDDAASVFRSLRTIAVDWIYAPLGRGHVRVTRRSAPNGRKSKWKSMQTILHGSVRERSSCNMRYIAPHQQLRSHSYENATCGMRLGDPLGLPQRGSAAHRQRTSNGDHHNNGCYLRLHPRRARVALYAR